MKKNPNPKIPWPCRGCTAAGQRKLGVCDAKLLCQQLRRGGAASVAPGGVTTGNQTRRVAYGMAFNVSVGFPRKIARSPAIRIRVSSPVPARLVLRVCTMDDQQNNTWWISSVLIPMTTYGMRETPSVWTWASTWPFISTLNGHGQLDDYD